MQCARLSILSYLALVAHAGAVGDALEGRELVQVNGLDGKKKQADQFSPFFATDCYENNAIWWRHLAPKKVAPILNALMNWSQKLIDCNTVSDGYFDTLWTFVDAF